MAFDSEPERVLRRGIAIQIALGLLLLPAIGALVGAVAAFTAPHGKAIGGVVLGGIGLLLLAVFAWAFRRERAARLSLHREGIVMRWGGTERAIRWDDVQAIHVHAASIALGGRGGVRKLIEGASFTGSLDDRASHVEITIAGDGHVLQFNKSWVGCVDAYRTACARVYPRKLADGRRALDAGLGVAFGKVALTQHKVEVAGTVLSFGEIESFTVENGALVVRKPGKMFAAAKVAVRDVANLDVLLTLHAEMTGRAAPPPGAGVVRGQL